MGRGHRRPPRPPADHVPHAVGHAPRGRGARGAHLLRPREPGGPLRRERAPRRGHGLRQPRPPGARPAPRPDRRGARRPVAQPDDVPRGLHRRPGPRRPRHRRHGRSAFGPSGFRRGVRGHRAARAHLRHERALLPRRAPRPVADAHLGPGRGRGGEPPGARPGAGRGPALRVRHADHGVDDRPRLLRHVLRGIALAPPDLRRPGAPRGSRRLRLAGGRPRPGRPGGLPLHVAASPAGAAGTAPARLGGLLRHRHRRLRALALVLAHLPRAGPERARRPRLHGDPADAAAAAHARLPARPDDVREHDLLHGRAAARGDGGRPRGLAVRVGRRRGDLRPWSRAGSPRCSSPRAWPRRRPRCAATSSPRGRPRPDRPLGPVEAPAGRA